MFKVWPSAHLFSNGLRTNIQVHRYIYVSILPTQDDCIINYTSNFLPPRLVLLKDFLDPEVTKSKDENNSISLRLYCLLPLMPTHWLIQLNLKFITNLWTERLCKDITFDWREKTQKNLELGWILFANRATSFYRNT